VPEVRLALNEEDFRKLASGRIIETEIRFRDEIIWLQIGLRNIGNAALVRAVEDVLRQRPGELRPADRLFEELPEGGGEDDPEAGGEEEVGCDIEPPPQAGAPPSGS
jgi:hypothetical protein